MKQYFPTLLLIFASAFSSFAQEQLKTTELNIFKNGTYFVVKEGEVNINDFVVQLPIPINTLLGTYWLTTTKDFKIQKIDCYNDTIKKQSKANTMIELLQANKGKKVKLILSNGNSEARNATGVIGDILMPNKIVKLKNSDGSSTFIPASQVLELYVENPVVETFTKDSLALMARLMMNKKTGKPALKLTYMQTEMNWIPTYNIKIINDKQLQIELKAVIENFSETIDDAEVTVTVGNPNMKFGYQRDPIASDKLTSNNELEIPNVVTNYAFGKSGLAEMEDSNSMRGSFRPDYQEYQNYNTGGEKTNDLYMYKLGKLSMKKDSKTVVPIFSATVNYDDIYEVQVPDDVYYRNSQFINKSNDEKYYDVFHALKLTNSTGQPLTTAPVFVQDEKLQPLAQDELSYTPTNGKVKVQLSKAYDVLVTKEEEEKSKEERALKLGKSFYNRIVIKGKIKLENNQNKSITVNCSKSLAGKAIKASDEGKITIPGKYNALNVNSDVEWNIKLNGGESKTVEYEYEVFVYVGN